MNTIIREISKGKNTKKSGKEITLNDNVIQKIPFYQLHPTREPDFMNSNKLNLPTEQNTRQRLKLWKKNYLCGKNLQVKIIWCK